MSVALKRGVVSPAVRPFLTVLATVLAALALNFALVRARVALDLVTPSPEKTVQSFVTGLSAQRWEFARHQLDESARPDFPPEELERLDDRLRQRHGHYTFVGGSAERAPDHVSYRALIKTQRNGVLERAFRLERTPESALWKIVAFEPLG
jgi:hypothetical protein